MKKTILSIALTAVAMLALTACGGNGENNANGTDSTATEQVEENAEAPAEVAEVPIKEQKELECDNYLIKVPEGAEATSRVVGNSCNMTFKDKPFTTIALMLQPRKTMAEYKSSVEKEGFKAVDDMTANGKTFSVFYKETDRDQFAMAAIENANGVVQVKAVGGASSLDKAQTKEIMMKNLQSALDNLTVK